MISLALALLIALAVTAIATPWVRQRALNWGAVDDPSRARKVHTRIVPRLGGLAIAAGFFAALLALIAAETQVANIFGSDVKRVLGLFCGGFLMLALGVYDDLKGANARHKLTVQFIAAGIVCALGFTFDHIALPWGGTLHVGLLGVPIAFIWIIGITNAVNLIDGLDGLASGVCLFAVIAMGVVSFVQGNVVGALVSAALAGALIGFLFHNFHPATIFMGDTGSLFIGFTVAATGLMTSTKSSTALAVLIPILALGLPIMDTTLATFRRVLRGRSPFDADQEHVHHRLLGLGLSHRSTVLAMWAFCLVACIAAVGMLLTKGRTPVYIIGGFSLFGLIVARLLGYLRVEEWRQTYVEGQERKRSTKGRRQRVLAVVRSFDEVASFDALFGALAPLHRLFGYGSMRLEVFPSPASLVTSPVSVATLVWERAPQVDATPHDAFEVGFDVYGKRGGRGRVAYRYVDGRTQLAVDDEPLLKVLHDALGVHIERLLSARPVVADEPAGGAGLKLVK